MASVVLHIQRRKRWCWCYCPRSRRSFEVVKKDGYGMRSVAYGNMVGVLIEAIKEQQAQIEELKLKLNEK